MVGNLELFFLFYNKHLRLLTYCHQFPLQTCSRLIQEENLRSDGQNYKITSTKIKDPEKKIVGSSNYIFTIVLHIVHG